MRNIYYLFLILAISSCELKESPFDFDETDMDTPVIAMDPFQVEPDFNISSFAKVPDIEGNATCLFSLTKNAFINRQYIYAGTNSNKNGFMQVNGEWVEFSCQVSEMKDSLHIRTSNANLQLEIQAKKDSTTFNKIQYRGEIMISIDGEEQIASSVYGECDC